MSAQAIRIEKIQDTQMREDEIQNKKVWIMFYKNKLNSFFLKVPKKPKIVKNINFPNLAITANKPTLAKTFPATRPPIVHAATSSTEESNSSYLYPSLN